MSGKSPKKKPGAGSERPDPEDRGGSPMGKKLEVAFKILMILGPGWGLLTLFGYYWVIVDLAAAPLWVVVVA